VALNGELLFEEVSVGLSDKLEKRGLLHVSILGVPLLKELADKCLRGVLLNLSLLLLVELELSELECSFLVLSRHDLRRLRVALSVSEFWHARLPSLSFVSLQLQQV